tara:strand:+ start:76 stop:594 length:519 start_codon:yes stop_codon:yes gene_type:complete
MTTTLTKLKKTAAKQRNIPQNRVNVKSIKSHDNFDVFTQVFAQSLLDDNFDIDRTASESTNETSTQGGRGINITICEMREIKNDDFKIQMTPTSDGGVEIYKVEVSKQNRGEGLGTFLFKRMTYISEKMNTPLYLIPVDYTRTIGDDTLRKFYKNLGFSRCCKNDYWSNFKK